MSLTYALAAAVNGTTGLRAILLYGLVRTKHRRRRSGQHQRRGFSRPTGGRASGQEHSYQVTPKILGRRRATQRMFGQTNRSTGTQRVSPPGRTSPALDQAP
jgi:hypothetical protein